MKTVPFLSYIPPYNSSYCTIPYGSLPLEGVRTSNDTSSKIVKITLSKLSHLMANMSKMTENHFFKILPFTVQNVENRFFKNQWKKHQNIQIRVLRKWNVSKVRTSLFIPFLIIWPLKNCQRSLFPRVWWST